MDFHWDLNDSKFPQVSRTLLSILADLNNAVIWMLLILLLISCSSSLFSRPLETVPRAPAIGITVTFMFHSFFSSLARSKYLFIFLFSFIFILWSAGMAKSTRWQAFFFFFFFFFLVLLINIWSGLLADIGWFICISKSLWILWISFSRTDFNLCIYHLSAWSNSNL